MSLPDHRTQTVRLIIVGILLAAILERVAWIYLVGATGAEAEAFNVARAVAEGRGLADAYRIGSGATAHLTPITPLIAGGIYTVFGVQTNLSETILAAWSIGLALGAHLLLFRGFGHIGVPVAVRLLAFAWNCLAPTYLNQEAVDFRIWEGGLTSLLAAWFVERILNAWRSEIVTQPMLSTIAMIGGLIFFVNPLSGVAAIATLGMFSIFRLSIRQTVISATVGALTIAIPTSAWMARNAAVLGYPVPSRSNVGLELSLSNYPGTETTTDHRAAYLRRMTEIHPTVSDAGYRSYRQLGEVEYFRLLQDSAVDWGVEHPMAALKTSAAHIVEMFFPSSWKFDPIGRSKTGWLKTFLARLSGVLGLCGLVVAITLLGRAIVLPAIYVFTIVVLISPFEPVVRYIYVVTPILVNFASCLLLIVRSGLPDRSTVVART